MNIPLEADHFDEARDGRQGENVIDRIEYFKKVLSNKSRPQQERVEALKFLVHFVGDVHQPLHSAERNGDKGGNKRLVFLLNDPKAKNLHTVWDSSLIDQMMGGTKLTAFVVAMDAKIQPVDARSWASGTAKDWAEEAHLVAREHVYKNVPVDGPPPKLDRLHVQESRPVVERQLERAGIRLAYLLNQALAPGATTNPSR